MNIDGILIAASAPERARLLVEQLAAAGWTGISSFDPARPDVLAHVRSLRPAAVVLELGEPSWAAREQAFRIARDGRWPVVCFVDQADADAIDAAMTAGIASYVVRGLWPGRVQPVVETAIARHRHMELLRRERDDAVNAFSAFFRPVGP
jgi:response regulator NasT